MGLEAQGVPMNEMTQKQVITVSGECLEPMPLRAIYAVAPPHENRRQRRIHIETMSPREAFLALVANTSNYRIVHSQRLQRQVSEIAQLLCSIQVQKLSYPRSLARLPEVREAILADTLADEWSAA
jgi:hypothetical protein